MIYIINEAAEAIPLKMGITAITEFYNKYQDTPMPEDVRRDLQTATRLLRNAQLWYIFNDSSTVIIE